jgi:hypothetical protein
MQKSGRLQHDVNTVLHDGASVFHVIGDAIKGVDKVTGSFLTRSSGFVSKHAGGVGKTLFDAVGAIAAGGATTDHLLGDLFGAAHDGAAQGAKAVLTPGLKNIGRGGSLAPSFLPTFPGTTRGSRGGSSGATTGPFGGAQPIAPFKSFALTLPEQLTQARADLTKSTADDVAAAKEGDRPDQAAHGRGETLRQEPPPSPPG